MRIESDRVAEVLVTTASGEQARGSAYRVMRTIVLTASHVVRDAREIFVRFNAGQQAEWHSEAKLYWSAPDECDVALLLLSCPNSGAEAPAEFGHIQTQYAARVDCEAVGFPLFKIRKSTGNPGRAPYRERLHAHGTIATLSNAKSGTFEVTLTTEPGPLPPDLAAQSPPPNRWGGMSGAAVWSAGRIIGVVTDHYDSEGSGVLVATPIRLLYPLRSEDSERLRSVAFPSTAEDLADVTSLVAAYPAETAHDVAGLDNPYLGLTAFTYVDRACFAGRGKYIRDAVTLLTESSPPLPLLFVTGASGSGKSSLAQAGVIPRLEAYYEERQLTPRSVAFRPGKQPLHALADALIRLGLPRGVGDDPETDIGGPHAFTAYASTHTQPDQINLIVIDQFEELFTLADSGQAGALIGILSELAPIRELRTQFVATLRSDYLGELYPHRALFDRTKVGVDLREMNQAELQEAIQRPLQVRAEHQPVYSAKAWEPQLVSELTKQAQPSPTYLPLLQLTLQELWRRGKLTLAAYYEIGGTLTSAIQNRATSVLEFVDYDRANPRTRRSTADQQDIIRIFLSLVQVSVQGGDRPEVRQPRMRDQLVGDRAGHEAAHFRSILDDLITARLLSSDDDYIDIIHESLIANWDKIKSAISGERQRLQQRARFEHALQEWIDNDLSDEYLLVGIRLAEARTLDASGDVALIRPDARRLFERSIEYEAEIREEVLRKERERRQEAERLRDEAETQRQVALARWLVSEARIALDADPTLLPRSVLLAVESLQRCPTAEADLALRNGLKRLPRPVARLECQHGCPSIAVSEDVTRVLAVSGNGYLDQWESPASSPSVKVASNSLPGKARHVTMDATGRWVAVASESNVVCIDLLTADTKSIHMNHEVLSISLSANAERLAIGDKSGTACVMAYPSLDLITQFRHKKAVSGVALNNNGTRLASVSWDGTCTVWDVDSRRATANTGNSEEPDPPEINAVAIDTDATLLATASRSVLTVSRIGGEALFTHSHNTLGDIDDVAITPDGQRVATGSKDGTAAVLDIRTHQEVSRACPGGHVEAVALSRDGAFLVTGLTNSKLVDDEVLLMWGGVALWECAPYEYESVGSVTKPECIALATGGTAFVGADDGALYRVDEKGACQILAPVHSRIGAIALCDKNLHVFHEDGTLRYLPDYQSKSDASTTPVHIMEFSRAAISADCRRVACVIRTAGQSVYDDTYRVEVRGALDGELITSIDVGPSWKIALDRCGDRLAVANGSRHAEVWQINEHPTRIASYEANHIYSVGLSADGSRLAFSSFDSVMIKSINGELGDQVLKCDGQWLWCVALTPSGNFVATGTDKGLVVVWDVQTGVEICRLVHTGDVRYIALSEDGAYVGAATGRGEVRVWAVRPEILIEEARSRVTRNLDEEEWKRYFGKEPYRKTFKTLGWDELQVRDLSSNKGSQVPQSIPDTVPLGVSGSVTVPLSDYVASAGSKTQASALLLDENERIAYLCRRIWDALGHPLTPGSERVAELVLGHFAGVDVVSVFAKKAMQTLRDGTSHNVIAISADDARVAAWFVAWNGTRREMQAQRFGNYLSQLVANMRRLVDQGVELGGCLEIDAYVRENADTSNPGRPLHEVLAVEVEYSYLPGYAAASTNTRDTSLPNLIMLNPDLCTQEENQLLRKLMERSS